MSITGQYLDGCALILEKIRKQEKEIVTAAGWFAGSILAGRVVHVFGSGHSRIMVEEMWPRYGSFPGFNPIVELSMTFHNLVIGANGQRQAMFIENIPGLAERILRNFGITHEDTALIISSGGTNQVPVEMAEIFQQKKIKVVAILTKEHAERSPGKRKDGKKLYDFADLVLDTAAPPGDAMVQVPGLETPVSPGSSVGGILLINAIKAELARLLTAAGHPPKVLSSGIIVGEEKARALFESAYDEHAHRMAAVYHLAGRGDAQQQP